MTGIAILAGFFSADTGVLELHREVHYLYHRVLETLARSQNAMHQLEWLAFDQQFLKASWKNIPIPYCRSSCWMIRAR